MLHIYMGFGGTNLANQKAEFQLFVTLSAKTHIVRTASDFFQFSQHYLQCLRSEVIALDNRASKKIDLYSNHTENKL